MDRLLHELVGLWPLLALGGALYWLGLVAFTTWLITHPPRRTYSWAVARGLPGDPGELDDPLSFEELEPATSFGPVRAWRITGARADGPVVILSPGWSDSRVGALTRVGAYASGASAVVAWDPPGLGESGGWCSLGAREGRMLAELARELCAGRPVVLAGWSLGAGASLDAAVRLESEQQVEVAGVVAEVPYRHVQTPASAVMRMQRMPWRLNLWPALWVVGLLGGIGARWRGFDRAGLASRLRCPLLVLHGTLDPVSPFEDGQAIADAAPDSELVVTEEGSHNDLWVDEEFRPVQERAVTRFLQRLGKATSG
ncbi:MAG: alpha/beta fold hydrolase [Phycisphaerales bacterium JB040]